VVNVVITGASGFLGSRLARHLLAAGTICVAGAGPTAIRRLTLTDRMPVPADLAADERVSGVVGELAALAGDRADPLRLADADVIFHLAAAVSGECEADFDLGLRANLRATESLLQSCRAAGSNPLVVFASSVAAFGGAPDRPLPAVVTDDTPPNPQTSYGTQKVICEHLLADFSRKGFLRGRSIRLMTVSVRPGTPNGAASGFLSGIIREPLAGQRATCPVEPGTEVALASPATAIDGLLRAASASDQDWGGRGPVNLPALTVSVGEMARALERVAGPAVAALIDWVFDPAIAAMFATWPGRVRSDRATALGLVADPDFESIIRLHIAESASGGSASTFT
jgi:D-erythronate 2-dehydrogenase